MTGRMMRRLENPEAGPSRSISGQGSYAPYPNYKDSGIEWLGEIPAHWEVKRLKYFATINDETLPGTTAPGFVMSYIDIGDVDLHRGVVSSSEITFENAPDRARRVVRDGDTIVSTVRTYLGAITPIRNPVPNTIVSTGFAVVRPRRIFSDFMAYLLRESSFVGEIVSRSSGVSYPAVNAFEIETLPILLPDLDEQRDIAAFLDHETAKIDTLIEKQERLINLLQERRIALIGHAVRKGLDSNVPMKHSGIEWLGEIPAHWEVKRLKYLATINDETLPETTASGFVMSYIDIGGVDLHRGGVSSSEITFENAPDRARRVVRDGDTVVSTVHTYLGAITPIRNPVPNTIVSTGFAVVRPRRIFSDFMAYLLREPSFVGETVSRSLGVGYPEVNAFEIGALPILLPDLDEQRDIVAFLDHETEKIDSLITKINQVINLQKELRSVLISVAVTGKIDVRQTSVSTV